MTAQPLSSPQRSEPLFLPPHPPLPAHPPLPTRPPRPCLCPCPRPRLASRRWRTCRPRRSSIVPTPWRCESPQRFLPAPRQASRPVRLQVDDTAAKVPPSRGSDDSDSAKSGRRTQDAAQDVPRLTPLCPEGAPAAGRHHLQEDGGHQQDRDQEGRSERDGRVCAGCPGADEHSPHRR